MMHDAGGRKSYDVVARVIAAVGRPPETMEISASWTDGRDWSACLTADGVEARVSYGPASTVVASVEEAAGLLKAIFNDEIVCVTALDAEAPIHYALAPHNDPTASFNRLGGSGLSVDVPSIDHIMIRSWTGKHDRE